MNNTKSIKVPPRYSFTIHTEGDKHTIIYRRKMYSPDFYIFLFLGAVVLFMMATTSFFLAVLFYAFQIGLVIYFIKNRKNKRGEIQINRTQLILKDRSYVLADLGQAFLDKKYSRRDKRQPKQTFYYKGRYYGPGLWDAVDEVVNEKLRNRSNCFIAARYAEKTIIIADKMKQETAEALFEKIAPLLRRTEFSNYQK